MQCYAAEACAGRAEKAAQICLRGVTQHAHLPILAGREGELLRIAAADSHAIDVGIPHKGPAVRDRQRLRVLREDSCGCHSHNAPVAAPPGGLGAQEAAQAVWWGLPICGAPDLKSGQRGAIQKLGQSV